MPNGANDRDHRPSPEALLAEQEGRGRLRIFLGAAPGVGKTYTMLEAAHVRKQEGVDLIVGVVETHGRPETEELLQDLEIVPRRQIEYRGKVLAEMDLDAILARRPQLVLVDEFAHTNVPGSRHPKRYLDVEELLAAGIDVYTTVNIQHLESLNDAVAQITSIRVRETIPDRLLDDAAEIELVDLSPEELLQRLREGKVYVPDQAQRAIQRFFRLGNLTALRELALRRTAECVDERMQTYMQAHAIPGPWPACERIMVCVSPSPLSPRLVRVARRMADRRHAEWMAVYVETPRHHRLSNAERDRVAQTLRLAEQLGGEAVTWGLWPAIVAAILSMLVYDFGFVQPMYTFTVPSPQDLLALSIFLIVAVLTSHLTARVRDQAEMAKRREARTAALYALSREVASATGLQEVLEAIVTQVSHILNAQVVVLLPEAGRLVLRAAQPSTITLTEVERATATWAWQHNQPAGRGADTLPGGDWFYQPLSTAQGTLGVVGLQFETPDSVLSPAQRRLLDALAGQAAVAIERARLVEEREQSRLASERERLVRR
jgi:K+-sensing histidine kinase KdpD